MSETLLEKALGEMVDRAHAYIDQLQSRNVTLLRERDAATARAERAEAENARLRAAAKAYRQAEQDYVFMAERPDEEYVAADVHLARMHMHRAAISLDAALAPVEAKGGDDA